VGDLTVPRRHRLPARDPVIGAAFSALQSLLAHLCSEAFRVTTWG
jgi:hypothetical protein